MVMCRNEERWIERVLRPLWTVFGVALVGDTGSTDETLPILRRLHAEGCICLTEYGLLSMAEVGQVRKGLAQQAQARGARYAFLVDADELYCVAALESIVLEGMPAGCTLGFTAGMLLDEDEAGNFYEMTPPVGMTGRTAMFLPEDEWKGEYPFESMQAFSDGRPHHYFALPAGLSYHHVHLHRLVRSSKDADVPYRVQKRMQYAMQEVPGDFRGAPFDMAAWCTK